MLNNGRLSLLFSVVVLLGLARAQTVLIDFDSLPANSLVGTAFAPDVVFTDAQVVAVVPISPPNAIRHATQGFIFGPATPIRADFGSPMSTVTVTGSDVGSNGLLLRAFDSSNNLLDSDSVTNPGVGVGLTATLTVTSPNIAYVLMSQIVTTAGDGVVFDNFVYTFDVPPLVCQTYSPPQSTDGCGSFCDTLGTITQTRADLGCNPTDNIRIDSVSAQVSFLKTDGSCGSPAGGFAFHSETNYRLDASTGTNVILANPGTWSGGAVQGAIAEVTFEQGAATTPSGTPSSGTFLPNGGNLNNFNGDLSCGDVSFTLRAGDTAGADPLCTSSYCVRLSATCVPNTPPVLSGCQPATVNLNTNPGACCATGTFSTPTATDPDGCPTPSVTRTSGGASGSCFTSGNTVQFTATDSSGATDTCSWTYVVTDNEAPQIACPSNIASNTDPGTCDANVNFVTPVASDNCAGVTTAQTAGLPSGASFALGVTTQTFQGTDSSGLTASCSFSVTVSDAENPGITCPGNIGVGTAPGLCTAPVSYTIPVATDNCPGVTTSQTSGLSSGASFPLGDTTQTFLGTDGVGLTSTCSFTVSVSDTENPALSCPGNIATNTDPGICNAVVNFATPVATDNCPGVTTSQTLGLPSGASFPLGSTTQDFVGTDGAGLASSCSFVVSVSDAENPGITCPANIGVITAPGTCSATVSFLTPSATDNCPGVTTSQTAGFPSGTSFPLGSTTQTFQGTDGAGLTASCSFAVTVTDIENPSITCPSDIVANTEPGVCSATVNFATPVATDNCPGVTTSQTSGFTSGSPFPLGTTSQAFLGVDSSGLTASCGFSIDVLDAENPTVTCPSDITINNDPGLCTGVVTYNVLTSDNCPGPNAVLLQGLPSGSPFSVGTTNVVYNAVDTSDNNSPSCDFNVNVLDVESPTIVCPADVTLAPNTSRDCSAQHFFNYIVGDNCGTTITSSHPSGTFFTGTTTVTGTVTDPSGNSASCSFVVTVIDNVSPTIECFSATASTDPGVCSATVFFRDPSAFDVCGVDITRTGSAISGQSYVPGTYTSTFTATDPSGNFDTCVSTIEVVDSEPPVVTGCPADIEVSNDSGCDEVVTWDDSSVTRTDNCGVISSGQSHTSGSSFPIGLTSVSYTAIDAANNVGQCSFVVRVLDNQSISFVGCPSSFTTPSSCSDSGTPVSWAEPTVSSGECLTYESRNFAPGSRFPDGVTTINYVAVADEAWATCLFDVTVEACPAENGANRPPGAIGTIDLDGDGYYSDAPLLEWRDCCDSPEDLCDDPFLVNPGAFEIAANGQQDSCRGTSRDNDADSHISGCDRNFVFGNDFQLVGPTIPSEQTNEAVWALDLCEFKEDDDDPSWGFDEQQTMVFSLANGTRNGYDIGIVGPATTQASVVDHFGGIVPARGDFMLAMSSGTARDETTGGHQSPTGATTGNTIVNLPATFLDSRASTFIEDCDGLPYAVGVDSIRAHFRMRQPTNMHAFSFQALYMDFELEAAQGSYPALGGTCDIDRKSWFLAIKTDSKTGVSGNFAGDSTGRSFNSFNANPAFWSQCNDYGDFAAGLCRDGSTSLELTGFTGASNWTPIGTSAEPGETFSLEFVTFDGQDGANDVTVLLDDFFPITEARTSGSSSWASQPWGYQYTADLELVHLGFASGSAMLSKSASSATLEFTLRNWGPEEANDVTIAFTPPLGARFTAAKDSNGASLSCVTQPAATPYEDNGFVKCKWPSNEPLANQATRSGSIAFALDLDCAACPAHTVQMRFRLTSTLSSVDHQLSNNYLTVNAVFV